MPKFFFFLNIGGRRIDDHIGRILPDLATARLLACQEYPRLNLLAAEDNGALLSIEIRHEDGNLLDTIAETADVGKTG
jgi:hypothetical protein